MGDLAKEAESIILRILPQEDLNVCIAGIEALDSIGANIDKIQVIEDNITITAREWVLFRREKVSKAQEAFQSRGIKINWGATLSSYTPPLKDPHNFRNP